MADWKAELSFSLRLTETAKMQDADNGDRSSAYKAANPTCLGAEAAKHAKSIEETARKDALNLAEYEELCAKAVRLLLTSVPTGPVEDHHVDEHIFPNLPTFGAQIGRYVNAQHYNDGLFSEVFKAVDPEAGSEDARSRLVALKITTPDMMQPPHDSRREARILTEAKGDHIIALLDTFQQAGGHFVLAFPFLPCGFDSLLARDELHDISRKTILRDLLAGLAHLHGLGIIHRDIKPSNVLLSTPTGPAYITDFGIAWSPTDPSSEPTDQKILDVGTTCYRPPELLFGHQAYDTKLDIWAAGCVASQVVCLKGDTLFDAGDLGSELALIKSIFETLGTPDAEIWPEAQSFPDWGKMNFTRYPAKAWEDILPQAVPDAVDLVRNMVVYESKQRLSVEQALKHPYFG
ncbi:hypothetical protein B0A50_07149 [Salinomyces thailandicus]|uniref:cyclin-dependent kinase n=1 Tax=Salinomyces thailandicus TaxID=706561 RepID=A0A4V5N3J6_9PEZI|nr:hypothetical protein B0A50_07149 [Salinomyces thailandica]